MTRCDVELGNQTAMNATLDCFTTSEIYQNTTFYCHETLIYAANTDIVIRWVVMGLFIMMIGVIYPLGLRFKVTKLESDNDDDEENAEMISNIA